jgi:hypothetical protein
MVSLRITLRIYLQNSMEKMELVCKGKVETLYLLKLILKF